MHISTNTELKQKYLTLKAVLIKIKIRKRPNAIFANFDSKGKTIKVQLTDKQDLKELKHLELNINSRKINESKK